jgi:glutathione S-transferase
MTTLMMQLVLGGGGEGNPAAVFVNDRSRRGWEMVEARLGEAPFFGGRNLTTADIMMVYCVTSSRAFRGLSIDGYSNLKAYLARIGERPAYQRAMAKAEPGMAPMIG